eukprot:TRINITY_DN17344_c0_g1_i1.p3 TRINITY_DN17344_c0_g1~~TRINITY_DN17344_c0_g1_i1.p3  ORF type:complete len:64 (-),score=3.56 TRINITY_DN17344_c0_g1_i1:294-485(-)
MAALHKLEAHAGVPLAAVVAISVLPASAPVGIPPAASPLDIPLQQQLQLAYLQQHHHYQGHQE